MNLAKDGIDIGLRTNHIEPMLEFWTNEIGLPYDELLKTGPGARQHRLRLNGSSILKINHHREPQPDTQPSGYRELFIAQDIQQPVSIQDPDGNPVTLVPHGWQDIERIGMRMCVRSLAGSANFFVHGLKAEAISANRFRLATSVLYSMSNLICRCLVVCRGLATGTRPFRFIKPTPSTRVCSSEAQQRVSHQQPLAPPREFRLSGTLTITGSRFPSVHRSPVTLSPASENHPTLLSVTTRHL